MILKRPWPWDAAVIPPANDPAYRRTVFGSGYGLLSLRVDEAGQIISIFDIRRTRPSGWRPSPLGGELERHAQAGGHDDPQAGEVHLVSNAGGSWPYGWNRPVV
jgi:hypothetical protein